MNANFIFYMVTGIFVLTACAGQGTKDPVMNGETEPAVIIQVDPTEGQVHLMNAFRDRGLQAELGDSVEQPFFSVQGRILTLDTSEVQMFEYDSATMMEADAAQVAADGRSVGTTMLTWMATPHFYKSGQMLVLYVGDDATVLMLLESVLGEQFAGG